jgi:hypothetical protein
VSENPLAGLTTEELLLRGYPIEDQDEFTGWLAEIRRRLEQGEERAAAALDQKEV